MDVDGNVVGGTLVFGGIDVCGLLPPDGEDAGAAAPVLSLPPPPPQAASMTADAIARAVSAEVLFCFIFFSFVCRGRTPCATLIPCYLALREVKSARQQRSAFENGEHISEL
jgi:hypothetical protein